MAKYYRLCVEDVYVVSRFSSVKSLHGEIEKRPNQNAEKNSKTADDATK